jgi:hypothetical protein
MRNLADNRVDRYRIPHPAGEIPKDQRPYVGCFTVPKVNNVKPGYGFRETVQLRVIASRGGDPYPDSVDDPGNRWDHVSVSLPDRCPTWEEMCFIKELFFFPNEPAMQLHPVAEYINNHPYCLHLWRPLDQKIPLPPSILVGLKELNP